MSNKVETLQLSAGFKGVREEGESGLETALAKEVERRTGLKPEDVRFEKNREFTVLVTPVKGGQPVSGTSRDSYAEALESAAQKAGDYDPRSVDASLSRSAIVPYFEVRVTARSIDPENLPRYIEDQREQLKLTWGRRLNDQPGGESYTVIMTEKKYSGDSQFPAGEIGGEIGRGSSKKSLDHAAANADKSISSEKARKKVNSTVYSVETAFMVWGQEPSEAAAISVGSGHREDRKSYEYSGKRAGSPASRDPAYIGRSRVAANF